MQAGRRLIAAHVPFGVITKKSLGKLDGVKLLILSGVNMMDEEEADAIRHWVQAGGTLLASGCTSLVDKQGHLQKDFMLGDVFGVSIEKAEWGDREQYIAPTPAGAPLFGNFSAKYPAFVSRPGMQVTARKGAEVLATTTLPWPAPDPSKFSSIHSNPPWQPTDRPELVLNRFGQGRAVYSACADRKRGRFERHVPESGADAGRRSAFRGDAPAAVEMTVFHQPERHRYLLSLVNFQQELPNIPVEGIAIRARLPGETIHRVTRIPGQETIEHSLANGVVSFRAPRLETLSMFALTTM